LAWGGQHPRAGGRAPAGWAAPPTRAELDQPSGKCGTPPASGCRVHGCTQQPGWGVPV